MFIRKACRAEHASLTQIALRSKAYWGYDETFMKQCEQELTITEDYIEMNHVYVIEEDSEIKGFYSLCVKGTRGILDFLYVSPNAIGRGYGQKLWDHMVSFATNLAIETIHIDADPNAEGFYSKHGATKIGETPSGSIPNRMLPYMQLMI